MYRCHRLLYKWQDYERIRLGNNIKRSDTSKYIELTSKNMINPLDILINFDTVQFRILDRYHAIDNILLLHSIWIGRRGAFEILAPNNCDTLPRVEVCLSSLESLDLTKWEPAFFDPQDSGLVQWQQLHTSNGQLLSTKQLLRFPAVSSSISMLGVGIRGRRNTTYAASKAARVQHRTVWQPMILISLKVLKQHKFHYVVFFIERWITAGISRISAPWRTELNLIKTLHAWKLIHCCVFPRTM